TPRSCSNRRPCSPQALSSSGGRATPLRSSTPNNAGRAWAHTLPVTTVSPWPGQHRLKGWRARWWSPRAHPESRSTGFVPAEHARSEEHTSELQSRFDLVCRLLLEKKKRKMIRTQPTHSRSQPRREISLSFL